jgi:predicted amidohydrolase YtcJ
MVGAERFRGVNVEDVETREELESRIRAFLDSHPDTEVVHVYGLHYMTPPLLPADRAREVLDALVADRPVFVYAHDLHTAWANTKALEEAGLMREMPPFPELLENLHVTENLRLDSSGRPSGEMKEPDVYFLVEGPLRASYPLSVEEKLDYLERAARTMNRAGISSVHNMGLAVPEEDLETLILLLELEEKHRLPLRVHTSYSVLPDEHALDDVRHAAVLRDQFDAARSGRITAEALHDHLLKGLEQAAGLRHETASRLFDRHPNPEQSRDARVMSWLTDRLKRIAHESHVQPHLLRSDTRRRQTRDKNVAPIGRVHFNTVKVFVDGVVEQDTAYRLDQGARAGVPAFPPSLLAEVVVEADRLGLQVAAHCIGDGAVRSMLDAVEKARVENSDIDERRGHRVRHRVEHIELCSPEDISRFAELEVVASMQPLHERKPPTPWHEKVSAEHWETAFPWRGLLGAGTTLVFGSDWPIVQFDCLASVAHAVARRPWLPDLPGQGLSLAQAIDGFTIRPPFAVRQERRRGQLRPGMLADLLILSADLRDASSDPLADVEVVQTIVDGRPVDIGASSNR